MERALPEFVPGCRVLGLLPAWLKGHLQTLLAALGGELYLAGGVVRDLLLGAEPVDIDLTVPTGAREWAARLAELTGGAYVPLGREEDAARVVAHGLIVDFSAFREGAGTIAAELALRDLCINALGVRIDPLLRAPEEGGPAELGLIDPTGGRADLARGLIRACGRESFRADPLRMLRVFRFSLLLDFAIEPGTLAMVRDQHPLISRVAPERINAELDLIMGSPGAHAAMSAMAGTGLLWTILPELRAGQGMAQPASHHLDVWQHSLETLGQMVRILAAPQVWFPHGQASVAAYLDGERSRLQLQWAALLHDLGKPPTFAVNPDKGDRITFYNHDRVGSALFGAVARRLRWSNEDTERVARLIGEHMRPFFLANAARSGELTLRAAIRMIRTIGPDLPGLFLLAMADSLAGQGEARVVGMEAELAELYRHLEQIRLERVEPARAAPPLLTGRDLIEVLGLTPGPLFKTLLAEVEEARMEGRINDYPTALQLVRDRLAG